MFPSKHLFVFHPTISFSRSSADFVLPCIQSTIASLALDFNAVKNAINSERCARGFKSLSRRHTNNEINHTLEPLARFELATSSLPMRCYTPKPQWRISADLHDDYNASSNILVMKTSFSTVFHPQRLII